MCDKFYLRLKAKAGCARKILGPGEWKIDRNPYYELLFIIVHYLLTLLFIHSLTRGDFVFNSLTNDYAVTWEYISERQIINKRLGV